MTKIIIPLTLLILFAGCNSEKVEKSSSVSPGGLYRAELTVKDRGSCCRSSAFVTLYDLRGRIGKSELTIFEGNGGWPIKIHWADPNSIVVVFCDGDDFEVKSGIFENKEIEKTGTSSRFSVQVITDERWAFGGTHYCKK